MQIMQLAELNTVLDVYGALPDVGTDVTARLDIVNSTDVLFTIDLNATDAIAAAATATDHAEAAFNAPDGYADWAAVTDKFGGPSATPAEATHAVIYNGAGTGAECFRLSIGVLPVGWEEGDPRPDVAVSSKWFSTGHKVTFTATPKLTQPAGSYA